MSAKQCKELNIYKLLLSFIIQCFFSILISIPNKTISGESVFKILFLPSLFLLAGQLLAFFSVNYPGKNSILFTFRYSKRLQKIPNFIRLGVKMSFATFAFIFFFSSIVFILWILISYQEINSVYNIVNPPIFASVAFLVVQIAYVPNLIFLIPAWFTSFGVSFEYSVPFSLWESRQALAPSVPILAAYPTNDSLHLVFLIVLGAFLSVGLVVALFIIRATKQKAYRISFFKEKENIVKIERFDFGNTLSRLHMPEFINRAIMAFICCIIVNILTIFYLQIIFVFSSGVIGQKSLKSFGVDSLFQSLEICAVLSSVEILTLIIWSTFTIIRGKFAKQQT
jgi:hypothetical protein